MYLREKKDHGSQGIGSWLACQDFEPRAMKDPPCRGVMHRRERDPCRDAINLSRAQTSFGVGVRRGGANSSVLLVT
ncbi:hypothetical protein TNCV_2629211 [Trichonephila clavipes]|uniref:Uncharacterized protein n=1 Tax=Trichonephila clavipes TaxID=2585209 RepID=A0A8X6SJE3_TRICX|nr:hypothetical protein TNCV_2629211 [Trichonephila clavipes]